MQTLLDKLSIELVFTAHPTESKRRTMLNKLQRLSHRLQNPGALIEDEITGIENPARAGGGDDGALADGPLARRPARGDR